ncbi:MAG: hypothetical protein IPM48_13965 [Saprospiraceae bacterium]|nr:hypothetical protein [Saprospiraceae bacterium]
MRNAIDFNINLILVLLLLSDPVSAQRYQTAIGMRMGNDVGLSIQQKIAKYWTLEGIVTSTFQNQDLGIKLLAENHHPVLGKRFNMYFGAGPHLKYIYDSTEHLLPGLGMIAGLEITVGRLNASLDFQPSFQFDKSDRLFIPSTAMSIRYVLFKQKKKERKTYFRKNKNKKKH